METVVASPRYSKRFEQETPYLYLNFEKLPADTVTYSASSNGTIKKASVINEYPFVGELYWRLIDLRIGYKDDPELRASQAAFDIAMTALFDTTASLRDEFPEGYAYTDAEGGICIEWHKGESEVMLVVPRPDLAKPSIYSRVSTASKGTYEKDISKLPLILKELGSI